MFNDYAISLNGIQEAEWRLEQAARRIATANLSAADEPSDYVTLTDFAAELIAAEMAKTSIKANLEVISTRQELEHEILDLFA